MHKAFKFLTCVIIQLNYVGNKPKSFQIMKSYMLLILNNAKPNKKFKKTLKLGGGQVHFRSSD